MFISAAVTRSSAAWRWRCRAPACRTAPPPVRSLAFRHRGAERPGMAQRQQQQSRSSPSPPRRRSTTPWRSTCPIRRPASPTRRPAPASSPPIRRSSRSSPGCPSCPMDLQLRRPRPITASTPSSSPIMTARQRAVRWSLVPEHPRAALTTKDELAKKGPNALEQDLVDKLKQGPVVVAHGADHRQPRRPHQRRHQSLARRPPARRGRRPGRHRPPKPKPTAPAATSTYDPTILPDGIAISDDPLLSARSAAYAVSFTRRASEASHYSQHASSRDPRPMTPLLRHPAPAALADGRHDHRHAVHRRRHGRQHGALHHAGRHSPAAGHRHPVPRADPAGLPQRPRRPRRCPPTCRPCNALPPTPRIGCSTG